MSVFGRLAPRLQQAIVARLGWSSLRPVQEQAAEALLAGNNAVVLAPTAGGKTEAAMFPILSDLVQRPVTGVGALYIAPIKALLNNQAERLGMYTEMVGLGRFVWHGDTAQAERRAFLRAPVELLMTTPESLEVMLISQRVDARALFAEVRAVVIDEVHALAGTDRGGHLLSVIERIAALAGRDVQRVGLSATVGNPDDILAWLQGSSARSGVVVNPPHAPARRQLLIVHRESLDELSRDAARMARGHKSLFFCQSRSVAEAVAETMRRVGTDVLVHHSSVAREERELAEERFHHGSDACIVCTSTLELGIDVGDLDRVLQADAPDTVSSFLQRMGRTGRRQGQVANTSFFCQSADSVLQAVALVELARAGWVEHVELGDRSWPVLVHQVLAMALAGDGVTLEQAWTQLVRVPDVSGIHRAEYERLVRWMLEQGWLALASGRLILGSKAEHRFGRRNFMDLYAVFSSPQSYVIIGAAGQRLGTLSQAFVDRLVEGVSSFLLAGRAWAVEQIVHSEREVRVSPAPRGRQPTWGGFLPQFLGFRMCQQMMQVLRSGEQYGYLESQAAARLSEMRESFSEVLTSERGGMEVEEDGIRWWTFAGGRINYTLRFALEALCDWNVAADNLAVRVRGEGLDRGALEQVIEQLCDIESWQDDRLWQRVVASLPGYRLSKFQPLMPPWIEREMLADHLLDVEGAWRWLAGEIDMDADAALQEGGLGRVPEAARRAALRFEARVEFRGEARRPVEPVAPALRTRRLVRWVQSDEEMRSICEMLSAEPVIGLDIETTLRTRALCLVQLGGRDFIAVVDTLAISDLSPLAALLGDSRVVKVIHNASFERSVLAAHGVDIVNIYDTLAVSRRLRGRGAAGGHGLAAVCTRELGMKLDKRAQTSDWTRRPLSEAQLVYAALDAEVLLDLYEVFCSAQPGLF